MENNISPKQTRFVEEYLVDLNATQAAIRAGYSQKTARQIGSENLAKPDIQNAITSLKIERSARLEVDADWVLQQAINLFQRCMQEVRPTKHPKTGKMLTDDAGNSLFTFNASAANRALELIGKHVEVGAFKDRLEIETTKSIVEKLKQGRNRVTKAASR
jgi:phage terminase small subunit